MKKMIFDISSESPWSPHPNSPQRPNSHDFSTIDHLLHRFSVLEEITFRVDNSEGASLHILRDRLSKCEKKGILRIVRVALFNSIEMVG